MEEFNLFDGEPRLEELLYHNNLQILVCEDTGEFAKMDKENPKRVDYSGKEPPGYLNSLPHNAYVSAIR